MFPENSVHEVDGEVFAFFPIDRFNFKMIYLYSNNKVEIDYLFRSILEQGIDLFTKPSKEEMEIILEVLSEITR